MRDNHVTAGVLLIGDELLSGRTQDTNLRTIAKFLEPLGVQIVGPTHDDITADAVAAAFGLGITERADAMAVLRTRYSEDELNPARRRMARIPDGADLIKNPVSTAPGFQTQNVFTLAGVPSIMTGMLDDIGHRIKGGATVFARHVPADGLREGDAAAPLAEIAAKYEGVSLGSYPYFETDRRGINFVARSRDATLLDAVEHDLKALVTQLRDNTI